MQLWEKQVNNLYSQAIKQGKRHWLRNYYAAIFTRKQVEKQLKEAKRRVSFLKGVLGLLKGNERAIGPD